MKFEDAVRWLYRQQWHGIHLGLEVITRLISALRVPIEGARAPRFLHIAGTNGKGSVCAMLDAMLRAAGRRTGLFTSPHLVSFRERIRVDGEMIREDEVAAGLERIRESSASWDPAPTFFEIATALALDHFARRQCELVVLETGLGGRLDATNVVTPLVSVLTPIALDHRQYLGETLPLIAAEKAGIIKANVPVVSAPQSPEVEAVFRQVAAERRAPLTFIASPLEAPLSLRGPHQHWNAALAVQALEQAGLVAPVAALGQFEWPGRFQLITERVILDGAHNPAAAQILAAAWREAYGAERAMLILGVMKDKDAPALCRAMAPIAARVYAVTIPNNRSYSGAELAKIFCVASPATPCVGFENATSALEAAHAYPERVLVAGSLFLVGEVLRQFRGGGDGHLTTQ